MQLSAGCHGGRESGSNRGSSGGFNVGPANGLDLAVEERKWRGLSSSVQAGL